MMILYFGNVRLGCSWAVAYRVLVAHWSFPVKLHMLKPYTHDMHCYGTGNSRALFRIPPRQFVRKMRFLIGPYPTLHSQSPCANQNINATACYVCGDWLLCQTISLHNNPARFKYWFVCNAHVIRADILDRAMEH